MPLLPSLLQCLIPGERTYVRAPPRMPVALRIGTSKGRIVLLWRVRKFSPMSLLFLLDIIRAGPVIGKR
jgi:hypothetical protein